MSEIKRIIERKDALRSERGVWESHWQECADFVLPKRDQFTHKTVTKGEKKNLHLFDSTAVRSNISLSAGLHSTLTNPAVRFFDLTTGDPELDDQDDVRNWLQKTADKMWNVFQNSNFQTEIHEVYLDIGAFGTAPLYIEEHKDKVVNFMAYPVSNVYVCENSQGMIDEVYRTFKWTAKQILQEWPETAPESVKKAFEKEPQKKFEILHAIYPNPEQGKVRPFVSKYILEEESQGTEKRGAELSSEGYREFPWAIPRWAKESGETYGRSPAMEVLPDVKTLNQIVRTVLKGAQKAVDPPLQVPDDGLLRRIDLRPGGVNRKRNGSDRIEPIITGARVVDGMEMIKLYREQIPIAFFLDLFRLEPLDRATQIEVQQHIQERLKMLGPLLGRMHTELLRPMIDRVFAIMERREMIDAPPAALKGKRFEAVFSSPLAKAQKSLDSETVLRVYQMIAGLAQVDERVFDNFDTDRSARFVAKQGGFPQDLLRSEDEIRALREGRAAANEQAIERQQQQDQVEAVSKVAPAVAQIQQARAQ